MNAEGALKDVAQALGIEHGYHDIWGHWHALSQATAGALLEAVGVSAQDESTLEHTRTMLHERPWRRLAPPVAVLREGEAFELLLTASTEVDQDTLRWHLQCEDGSSREGESALDNLAVVEERELDGVQLRRRRLSLADDLPLGYHILTLHLDGVDTRISVIRTPARCHHDGGRHWGVSIQLYGLRSMRNWGMGDFTDLRTSIDSLAPLGAGFIGLNPLHALYPWAPEKASPYSPSSRVHVNPLYLDVEAIEDFAACGAARAVVMDGLFQARLAALREAELVDHGGIAECKFQVLELLFAHFNAVHMGTGDERDRAFAAFRHVGADSLRNHALFEALGEHFDGAGERLPAQFLDPASAPVTEFAREHASRVLFFQYLQWQCANQLGHARDTALQRGMSVGLYLDLAVGSDAAGSDVWAGTGDYARGVSIGAPPDDFAPQGQVWGLPPWRPEALTDTAYAAFIQCLRASMRHAGALRIDHVLGLLRMFWVADGGSAADGAYMNYPVRDLLAITALESVRENCLVVGEDLGTVPDAMRALLAEFGVLSYRVFYFEKHWHGDHSFRAPRDYPREALTTLSTHDLPTLAGFWTGRDLAIRHQLGLFPSAQFEAEQGETREHDRWRILEALEREGLRPARSHSPGEMPPDAELVQAIHAFLARSESMLLSIQLEDILGVLEQANVPGTVTEQPNWRRKLPLAVEAFAAHPALTAITHAVDSNRREATHDR